jgi:hypothetical protein
VYLRSSTNYALPSDGDLDIDLPLSDRDVRRLLVNRPIYLCLLL